MNARVIKCAGCGVERWDGVGPCGSCGHLPVHRWEIIHADGTTCMSVTGDEDYAWIVVGYFDGKAATGEPMSCSPHGARIAIRVNEEG